VTTKGNLPSVNLIAVRFVWLGQQALAHLLEVRQRAVMREQPDAVNGGVGVLESRRAEGRPPHMGDRRPRIHARRRLLEMLAVIGGPGLLLDEWHAVRILGHASAVAVGQPSAVPDSLSHQRVMGLNKAAFESRGLDRLQAV
jgi:hypothetical protein